MPNRLERFAGLRAAAAREAQQAEPQAPPAPERPDSPLGRAFRDLAGRAHQRLAAAADEIHVAILGTVLRVRPQPIVESAPRDAR